ncbi:hypothetical protein EJ02DRAFT_460008 [Clathrospora elynae]|uniref:Uncharacterized protein n=1 Tax=Clathrospora elynae TaxID=706981 RepID=A0A6A5S708_9PLEO|nr:hypothetical protein EJ02DRAFT_460008 [Clathrospora elynae]
MKSAIEELSEDIEALRLQAGQLIATSDSLNDIDSQQDTTEASVKWLWTERIPEFPQRSPCTLPIIDEHERDQSGNITLIRAASAGQSVTVEMLLNLNVNTDFKNLLGRTALMEAALWSRINVVRVLLNNTGFPYTGCQADTSLRDNFGNSSLDLIQDTEANRRKRWYRSRPEGLTAESSTDVSVRHGVP